MINEYKIKNDVKIIIKKKDKKSLTKYLITFYEGNYHFKNFTKDDSFALYIPQFASQIFDSKPMLELNNLEYTQIIINNEKSNIIENYNTYQILNSGFQFNYPTIKIHLAYCFDKVAGLSLFHS